VPGHCDWRAEVTLKKLAAYDALLKANTATFNQEGAVEFVEDWAHCIAGVGFKEDKESTMGAPKVIQGFQKLTLTQKSEQTSEAIAHSRTRSAMEEVDAKSRGLLPHRLIFTTAPYLDFEEREFQLRVQVSTSDKGPVIKFRLIAKERTDEEIGEEFKKLLSSMLADSQKLLVAGSFTP
jgi:uncharacterized protein YfdQ (DUF2303 family)